MYDDDDDDTKHTITRQVRLARILNERLDDANDDAHHAQPLPLKHPKTI